MTTIPQLIGDLQEEIDLLEKADHTTPEEKSLSMGIKQANLNVIARLQDLESGLFPLEIGIKYSLRLDSCYACVFGFGTKENGRIRAVGALFHHDGEFMSSGDWDIHSGLYTPIGTRTGCNDIIGFWEGEDHA